MKICSACFKDLELRKFIESNSKHLGKCDYCFNGVSSALIEFEEVLDFFSEFVNLFKIDPNGTPLIDLVDEDWGIFTDSSTAKGILGEVLVTVPTSLISPLDTVSYINEIQDCISFWDILREDLKWKRRFLTDISTMIELGWDSYFNKQVTLPASEILFRARIHTDGSQDAFPLDQMGCPPKLKATSGRANPQGIPYLYLSLSEETTLYETRATYLDELSIGQFQLKESDSIVLVDFTEEADAFVNMGNLIEYTKILLLKKLISKDLSKPIRRYDSELEYIPTQFICEFIRHFTGADGILFNSSLHPGGKNIVLFDQEKVNCISVTKHRVDTILITSSGY